MILFFSKRIEDNTAYLIDEEHRHCYKVLRKRVGDEIILTDGLGRKCIGHVTSISKSETTVLISHTQEIEKPSQQLHIAISPTKNNTRLEWFIEKATEIGVQRIIPIVCQRTERPRIKMDRLHKIVKSAATQSLKYHFPLLDYLTPLPSLLDETSLPIYVAHFNEKNPHALHAIPVMQDALIIIGPEGDFTAEELDLAIAKNATFINLSPYRLRTETAGLAACQLYHAINAK